MAQVLLLSLVSVAKSAPTPTPTPRRLDQDHCSQNLGVPGSSKKFPLTATMAPATVMLEGTPIGYPNDETLKTTCDQIAAFGSDGTVLGVSTLIDQGFSLAFFGQAGDLITFKYSDGTATYDAMENYTMGEDEGFLGSFLDPWVLNLKSKNPPSPPPSASPSPPPMPPPPSECADIPLVSGWQYISFNCIGPNSFDVMNSAPFEEDDKVYSRDGGWFHATHDGTQWQGSLVSQGFSFGQGYKVYFSGKKGSAITQSGAANPLAVQRYVLSSGWNWIGYSSSSSCKIKTGIKVVDGQFTTGDVIKMRSGDDMTFCTYNGDNFAGELSELVPGVGYEVRLKQDVTFDC